MKKALLVLALVGISTFAFADALYYECLDSHKKEVDIL
jgi:hypothetical protein